MDGNHRFEAICSRVFSYTNVMSQQTCLFSHDGLCHGGCTTLFDLRHDECYKRCFPGATAIIEILLLCDDRFYQDPLPLRSTFVCSFHKEEYLTEVWLTRNKKCWLCLSQNKSRVVSINFFLASVLLILIYVSFRMWVHVILIQYKLYSSSNTSIYGTPMARLFVILAVTLLLNILTQRRSSNMKRHSSGLPILLIVMTKTKTITRYLIVVTYPRHR